MARLVNGINGPFIGKVGSVTGYVVNGVGYMKGPTKNRTENVSDKELLNREKFTVAQEWLTSLTLVLRIGFKNYMPTAQGFSAAKSHLLANAIELRDGKWVVNPEKFQMSYGDLPISEDLKCEKVDNNSLKFSWNPDGPQEFIQDQAMMLAYDVTGNGHPVRFYGSCRDFGEYVLRVEADHTYHAYIAFIAADRSRQSHSVYMGTFTT